MSEVEAKAFGWKNLQFWASVPVLLVSLFIGGLFFRPFLVISVLLIAGMVLSRRPGKAGPIILLLGAVATLILNAGDPGTADGLTNLAAAQDFIPRILGIGGAVVALVAGIMVLAKGAVPAPAARLAGLAAAGLMVLLIAASVFSTATFESDDPGAQDLQVSAKDFEFEQEELSGSSGEVAVFFDNPDPSLHTFTIDELEVDLAVPPGKAKRVTFDAEPGEYEFYCAPHPDMTGTLTVT
jgi:plastocyanin